MSNRLDNVVLLKSQTIGVEIEFSKMSRTKCAKILAKYWGVSEDSIVHDSHNGLTRCYVVDPQGRKWSVVSDCSVNGSTSNTHSADTCRYSNDHCTGGELVTPILKYEDIEDLQKIVRLMREGGAKSGERYKAGVHIHVGADIGQIGGHDPRSLRVLQNMVASREDLLIDAVGVDRYGERIGYARQTNKDWLNALNNVRPRTMEQLKCLWYGYNHGHDAPMSLSRANACADDHYDHSRYHVLNYHAIWQKGTIEFRIFQFNGNIHAGELKAYIQLCLAMSSYAKLVRHASPVISTNVNKKFVVKNWLINMGLTGDEFKTCRKMLTKRLPGDTAYRNGRAVQNANDLDDAFIDRLVMEG